MTLNSFKWLYASIDWVMVMMMIKTIVWMRKIGMMVRYKQRWWWVFQGVVWRQEVLWVAFWRHHFLTGITNFGFPGSDRSSLCHRAKTQRRQDKKKKYKKDAKTQRQKNRESNMTDLHSCNVWEHTTSHNVLAFYSYGQICIFLLRYRYRSSNVCADSAVVNYPNYGH